MTLTHTNHAACLPQSIIFLPGRSSRPRRRFSSRDQEEKSPRELPVAPVTHGRCRTESHRAGDVSPVTSNAPGLLLLSPTLCLVKRRRHELAQLPEALSCVLPRPSLRYQPRQGTRLCRFSTRKQQRLLSFWGGSEVKCA